MIPKDPTSTAQQLGFDSLQNYLDSYQVKPVNKYISQEFQDYGLLLATELGDEKHKSLYIKMAKQIDRGILERARSFVKDANARSQAKLFMWKVKELRGIQGSRNKKRESMKK